MLIVQNAAGRSRRRCPNRLRLQSKFDKLAESFRSADLMSICPFLNVRDQRCRKSSGNVRIAACRRTTPPFWCHRY